MQELRYTIYPLGNIQSPVVNDKLAVYFDMICDTYGSGTIDAFMINLLYKQDSTCQTQGDYDYREFYHILTQLQRRPDLRPAGPERGLEHGARSQTATTSSGSRPSTRPGMRSPTR